MTLPDTDERAVQETAPALRPSTAPRILVWLLVALSAQFLLLGLVEAWKDAPTFDEGFYVSGGVTALTRHQLRLTPEHGILPKIMAALPALAARPVIPRGTSWNEGNQNNYYFDFMRAQQQAGKLRGVFFLARLPSLAMGIAIGWALYALAASLFGRTAGFIAAAAWLTTSYSLAFAHIAGSDLPFALALVLAALALERWSAQQTTGRLVVLGIACVGLLLTRFTGLVIVPILAFGVVVLAKNTRIRDRLLMATGVLVIAWAGVWVVFRAISPLPRYRSARAYASALPVGAFWRSASKLPWPKEYVEGILLTGRLAHASTATFLFGRPGDGVRWLYWPGAMLVKLPASALVLVAAALLCWFATSRSSRAVVACAVVLPLLVLIGGTVTYRRPSLRYFLPGIVLLFLLGAGVLALALRSMAGRVAVGVLALVQVAMLWNAAPHSLAWTEPPFRPGYRYIGDTSDWGQDYTLLKQWSAGRDAFVDYFGPPVQLPGTRSLFGTDPHEIRGWAAVSASYLTYQALLQPPGTSWLRAYCPVGTIAGTILIYRFRDPPDPRRGPVAPVGPCPGAYSHRVDRGR